MGEFMGIFLGSLLTLTNITRILKFLLTENMLTNILKKYGLYSPYIWYNYYGGPRIRFILISCLGIHFTDTKRMTLIDRSRLFLYKSVFMDET